MTTAHANAEIFRVSNANRSAEAAAVKVAAAKDAIRAIKSTEPRNKADAHQQRVYLAVLRMRCLFPDASLAEIAERMRMSTDT